LLGRLADRLRHLARLARAVADAALAIADHDERGEAEAPSALHDLGDAVDADELLDELALLALVPVAVAAAAIAGTARPAGAARAAGSAPAAAWGPCPATWGPCHDAPNPSLEVEAALAGGIGQGLDPAMKEIPAAVEDHGLDAGCQRPAGNQLADRGGGVLVGAAREPARAQLLVEARRRGQRMPLRIVDHLRIDVAGGTEDRKARPCVLGARDAAAHAGAAPFEKSLRLVRHGCAPTSSCLPCGEWSRCRT